MNSAAERMLSENSDLRERLLGCGSLEEALRKYSKDAVLARIKDSIQNEDDSVEIFGDRVSISTTSKRFQVEFGDQIILLRDVTGQYLIDREIGRLYRHELKAALDVMGIGVETAEQLIDAGDIEEGKQCLKQIEVKRLELFNMLEEKMDFIRLHSDAFRVRRNPLNLNLLVDKCVNNYRDAANVKKVALKSDHLHVDALFIQGEERFLVRAIDNIIRNALKFSPEKAEIKIALSDDNHFASVKILDAGPGIPPENIGKVFQLGFTTNGSGRGLYLARRIALAHGGRIEVKSKLGEGACFTIRLPLSSES
jgi:signal transduction histidine kinase